MEFGLDYAIFHLIGHREDHGRLIKKIDQILNILPNSSICAKGEVEAKSEWEQALLADFDFAELVDPSLDLQLLELPENFLKEESNPFFGPSSPPFTDPSQETVADEDFAVSSDSDTETSDLRIDPLDARCGDKRTMEDSTVVKEEGCETPNKRFKRARKMSLDLEWGYCPFDNMSDAPPSLEKVDDRLSPTFEEVNAQQKNISSALAYLQRSGVNKNDRDGCGSPKKAEESSRKSVRQQRLSAQSGAGSKSQTPPTRRESTSLNGGGVTANKVAASPKQGGGLVKKEMKKGVAAQSPPPSSEDPHVHHNINHHFIGDSGSQAHGGYRSLQGNLQRGPHDDTLSTGTGGLMMHSYQMGLPLGAPDGAGMVFGPNGHHIHVPKDGKCKMVGIYDPEARLTRVARFHEKRRARVWRKKIKYDCRKKLADDRPRIKGRFVKCSVPEKSVTSPKTPKETSSLFGCASSVGGDFKYRGPSMGPSASRPLSSMHMDYGMQPGHACPSGAASRSLYRPSPGAGKNGSMPPYKYPYSGPSSYSSSGQGGSAGRITADMMRDGSSISKTPSSLYGNGGSTTSGYQVPASLHQRPGTTTSLRPTFSHPTSPSKKTTKSAYMKKKERDAALSKALGRDTVPSSSITSLSGVPKATTPSLQAGSKSMSSLSGFLRESKEGERMRDRLSFETAKYTLPKEVASGPGCGTNHTSGYQQATTVSNLEAGKLHGVTSLDKAIPRCFDRTVATTMKRPDHLDIHSGYKQCTLKETTGPKKFSASAPTTTTKLVPPASNAAPFRPAYDRPLKEGCVDIDKASVESRAGRSPNSTLSPPLETIIGEVSFH